MAGHLAHGDRVAGDQPDQAAPRLAGLRIEGQHDAAEVQMTCGCVLWRNADMPSAPPTRVADDAGLRANWR